MLLKTPKIIINQKTEITELAMKNGFRNEKNEHHQEDQKQMNF